MSDLEQVGLAHDGDQQRFCGPLNITRQNSCETPVFQAQDHRVVVGIQVRGDPVSPRVQHLEPD
jgi:hypothetical protein